METIKPKPVGLLCLAMVVAFFWVACQQAHPEFVCKDAIGCVDLAKDDPLKIGILQALSGEVATLGQEQIRGFELALDQRQGRLLGRPVVVQTEDTGCSAVGGANAVLKIIADPRHVAIFGTTCSGAAATAAKAMSEAGLVMISGNNSAPFLTSIADRRAPNWQKGYFRTAANEENAGKAAAIYAYQKLGIRKSATINDGDIYTRGLTDGFNKAFQDLGGDVVLNTAINKGDQEMKPVLTAVLDAKAELLFFPLFQPEGNHILFQARKMPEFAGTTLMSDGALIDASFLAAVGDQGRGMYFVGPASPAGESVQQLERHYERKYEQHPSVLYYLSAYDAANILFAAIEKTAVRDDAGMIHIGRQALRDALYATRQFEGVTGSLSCDEFGDCARPVFEVLQMEKVTDGLEELKSNVKFTYTP